MLLILPPNCVLVRRDGHESPIEDSLDLQFSKGFSYVRFRERVLLQPDNGRQRRSRPIGAISFSIRVLPLL